MEIPVYFAFNSQYNETSIGAQNSFSITGPSDLTSISEPVLLFLVTFR